MTAVIVKIVTILWPFIKEAFQRPDRKFQRSQSNAHGTMGILSTVMFVCVIYFSSYAFDYSVVIKNLTVESEKNLRETKYATDSLKRSDLRNKLLTQVVADRDAEIAALQDLIETLSAEGNVDVDDYECPKTEPTVIYQPRSKRRPSQDVLDLLQQLQEDSP